MIRMAPWPSSPTLSCAGGALPWDHKKRKRRHWMVAQFTTSICIALATKASHFTANSYNAEKIASASIASCSGLCSKQNQLQFRTEALWRLTQSMLIFTIMMHWLWIRFEYRGSCPWWDLLLCGSWRTQILRTIKRNCFLSEAMSAGVICILLLKHQ